MNRFYEKTRKLDNIAVLIFSLLFMTVGFLQASSLTFGHPIISVLQWPTVGLGCLILLERFINFKHYVKTRGIILLILFAAGYVVSTIITFKYGYYNNVRTLAFMVMQFGLLYATDSDSDPEVSRRRFRICANFFLIGTAVLSILSFVFLFTGYTKVFYPAAGEEGPIYYIGFNIGRLFGAYWDPNIAATMAAVAIIISVFFAVYTKKVVLRVVYIVNAVIELMYISFADSRTGHLCLFAGAVVATLIFAIKYIRLAKPVLNIIATVAAVAICAGAVIVAPDTIQKGYNSIVHSINGGADSSDASQSLPDDVFDRGYDTSADISNRRFDIWKGAVEIFKTSPVFGVSRANILPYVDENLPDSYLVTNDHMRFDSMHNMYFEILASQGAFGLTVFLIFMVLVIYGVFGNLRTLWEHKRFDLFALVFCIAVTVCASTLVMAEIVYVTSPISTMLWIALGCMNHYIVCDCDKKRIDKQ